MNRDLKQGLSIFVFLLVLCILFMIFLISGYTP